MTAPRSSADNRTAYFIIGPTGSGKSTSARRLAAELDLPHRSADRVYRMLKEKYNIPSKRSSIINYTNWDDPRKLGIESWGEYPSIYEAKAEMYQQLLADIKSDFVIDGFTLSFPSERELVKMAVKPATSVIIRLNLAFELWKEFKIKKNPNLDENKVSLMKTYTSRNQCFQLSQGEHLIEFSTPENVCAASVLEQLRR